MKINQFFTASALAAFLVLGSCSDDDYADRFDELNQKLNQVIEQVQGAPELSKAIEALETEIGSLQIAVAGLGEGDENLALGLSVLATEIEAIESKLAGLAEIQATADELVANVADLNGELDLLKADLDELLRSSNVLTGELVIFDEDSLAAAKSLGDRVAIINGTVKILADDLDAAALNEVTSKIVTVTDDIEVKTNKFLDFSNLTSVGDRLGIVGEVDLSGLRSVGEQLELVWEGDYNLPDLEVVGDEIRLGITSVEVTEKTVGTGKTVSRIINFRNVRASSVRILKEAFMDLSSGVRDMNIDQNGTSTLLYFPNAASIVFGDVPVRRLEAPVAETIELHYEGVLGSDVIILSSATNITVKASEVDGEMLIAASPFDEEDAYNSLNEPGGWFYTLNNNSFLSNFGDWEAPADWISQINLPNLEAVSENVYLISNALTMPSLEEFDKDEDGFTMLLTQDNVQLPNLSVKGELYLDGATGVELASISATYITDVSLIETIKLNAQLNDQFNGDEGTLGLYGEDFDALTSLTLLGSTANEEGISVQLTDSEDDNNYAALETVVLGGKILEADVEYLTGLTSLTTSGVINDLRIYENDKLASLTLSHTHLVGGPGARLEIGYNDLLTTISTSQLDYVYNLKIHNNDKLMNLDLSSIKNLPLIIVNDNVRFSVSSNDLLTGTYKEFVEGSGTTAKELAEIYSNDLLSLSNFIAAVKAKAEEEEVEITSFLDFYFEIDDADDITTEFVEVDTELEIIDNLEDYTWESDKVTKDGTLSFD